jgi:surfactin synthase thioesterase subunit
MIALTLRSKKSTLSRPPVKACPRTERMMAFNPTRDSSIGAERMRTGRLFTLFCFPCAGASSSVFFSWRKLAPPWLKVEPIELPGHGARLKEPLLEDCGALTSLLTVELASLLPENYAFFGHSMGALLAYGVARQLTARKLHLPQALFVACCAAPSARDEKRLSRLDSDAAILEEV